MMMGRCCRCVPDVPPTINFRCFDKADGTLLWETNLNSPMMATDGTVYSIAFTQLANTSLSNITTTAHTNLPGRSAVDQGTKVLSHFLQHDGDDGTILTTSPAWNVAAGTTFDVGFRGSFYSVNEDGNICIAGGTSVYEVAVVEPNTTDTEITYYINATSATAGNITLRSEPATSDATFSITDDAATIQSAIATAFGAAVTSVTVTGGPVKTALTKIVIDWADNTKYLKSFQRSSPTVSGAKLLLNLQTAQYGTRTSTTTNPPTSTYQGGDAIWTATPGYLVKIGAKSNDATRSQVAVWDTSADPWTLVWEELLMTGFVLNSAESGTTQRRFRQIRASQIGTVAAAHPAILNAATYYSLMTIDDAGTNQAEWGTNLVGQRPTSLCLSNDDASKVHCAFQAWEQAVSDLIHGVTNAITYSSPDGTGSLIFDTFGTSHNRLSLGTYNEDDLPGFDNDGIAFIASAPFTRSSVATIAQLQASDADASKGGIDQSTTEEATGYAVGPATYRQINYFLLSPNNFHVTSCEWRLRWTTISKETPWLAHDATLSDLNDELQILFGDDVEGTQNVEASVDPISGDNPLVPMVWQQNCVIGCRAPNNMADAAISLMPLELSASTYAGIKPLIVEVRNVVLPRDGRIGFLDPATGSEVWSRGFSIGNPESTSNVMRGCLHGERFYVYSTVNAVPEL